MQLPLRNFATLVETMAASVQGRAAQLVDLTVGSTLRAILEANASIALWVQWLILLVLQTTRAATSAGSDLDSWMADFALTRLPASSADGVVTFSRFNTYASALIPAGTLVKTADGSQSFSVTSGSGGAWNVALGGYVVPAGTASLDVTVAAVTAGSAGNVQALSVTQLASAIAGVDTVNNAAPFAGGLDAESDTALRTRFANYIASRSRATPLAVGYAVTSIQQGLQYTIAENQDTQGNTDVGNFVVTVDDGTGNPPPSLLATATTAIEAVRPLGSTFSVRAPTVTTANLSMILSVASTTTKSVVIGPVAQAITSYIDALPIGATLAWSRLAQIAYDANTSVINVSGVLLNGGTADLVPPTTGVIKAGTVSVS